MSGELKAVDDIIDKRKRNNRIEFLIQWTDGTESWEQRTSLIADGGDAAKQYIKEYDARAKGGSSKNSATPKRSASRGRGRATTGRKAAKSPGRKAKSPAKRAAKSPAAKATKSPGRKATKSPARKAAKSPARKPKTPAASKAKKSAAKPSAKRSASRARGSGSKTPQPEPKPEPESESEPESEEDEEAEDVPETEDEEEEEEDTPVFAPAPDQPDDAAAEASEEDFATSSPRLMPPMGILAAWAASVALSAYAIESGLPSVLSALTPLVTAAPFGLAIAYVWELPAQGKLLDQSQAQATAASLLAQAVCVAVGCGKGLLQSALQLVAAVFRMLAAAGRPGDAAGASSAPLPVSIVSCAAAVATAVVATSASKLYNAEGAGPQHVFTCQAESDKTALGYMQPFDVPVWSHAREAANSTMGGIAAAPFGLVDSAVAFVFSSVQTVGFHALPCALQPANIMGSTNALPFVGDGDFTVTVFQVVTLCALAAAWARIGARPAGWMGSFEQWALLAGVLALGIAEVSSAQAKAVQAGLGPVGLNKADEVAKMVVQAAAGLAVAIGAGTS